MLKSGPNFGIHGTSYESARSILASNENWIMAHYLLVGAEEKKYPDKEFYDRLIPSLDVALKFTHLSHPAIILGIERGEYRLKGDSNPGGSMWGAGHSFPIGHDFYKWARIEVCLVEITPEEVLRITNGKSRIPENDLIGRAFYTKGKIMCKMVDKISEAVLRS